MLFNINQCNKTAESPQLNSSIVPMPQIGTLSKNCTKVAQISATWWMSYTKSLERALSICWMMLSKFGGFLISPVSLSTTGSMAVDLTLQWTKLSRTLFSSRPKARENWPRSSQQTRTEEQLVRIQKDFRVSRNAILSNVNATLDGSSEPFSPNQNAIIGASAAT